MTKVVFIVFIFLSAVSANPFKTAGNYYLQKDYEQAITMYQQILSNGTVNSSVYYNLGNSYYRTGKIGLALYYYLRASTLNPSDNDIQTNIRIASGKTIDKIEKLPEGFFTLNLNRFTGLFSSLWWSIMSLIFFVLLLGTAFVFLFNQNFRLKRLSFFLMPIVLIFCAVSIGSAFYQYYAIENKQIGVILAAKTVMNISPEESGSAAAEIHEGLIIEVTDSLQAWLKIKLSDGKTGWVKSSDVGVVKKM